MTITIRQARQTESLDNDEFLRVLNNIKVPFETVQSETAHSALNSISQRLMNSDLRHQAPQITALGFWLRPAAISQMTKVSIKDSQTLRTIPRGLAFHLPPSNVDTLFVYSWAISLLMGNSNIVRLPSKLSDVAEYLISTITFVLKEHGIESTQIFCSYPKNNTVVADICAKCDLRIIWGGDEKVQSLSSIPIKPDGISIGFSDRTAMSVISTNGYNQLDHRSRDDLARKFFNDIYWFDQMGCGSPRALIWLGKDEAISNDFFFRIQNIVDEKKANVEIGTAIEKFVFTNEMLITGVGEKAVRFSNDITYVEATFKNNLLSNVQGGGFLFQCHCSDIDEIAILVSDNLQTITHACLKESEINNLARLITGTGGYRIVPVGQALSFGPIWDGLDLFNMFSRKLTVDYGKLE